MKICCEQCDKKFEVEKAVALICEPNSDDACFLCSEICVKNYIYGLPHIYKIVVKKGGDK